MDKKLSRAIEVLDSLDTYFQSLESYIKDADREKFNRLQTGIAQCREYKKKFERLKLDDEGLFQAVHLYTQVQRTLKMIYDELDFELPVGEEISKTRAYRMSEVFNKITDVYRIYIRDVAAESTEVAIEASTQITSRDPLEFQRLWQKWPNSIELYTILQTRILNASYRDKNVEKRQQIFEILETDKRFILKEQAWVSPFLTFNCTPWRALAPMPWPELVKAISEHTPEFTFSGPASKIDGAIVVTRRQGTDVTHILPHAIEWGAGITESDIHETLKPVPASAWQWQIEVHDRAATENYFIFETLHDEQWRLLVPWKYNRPNLTRDLLVHKIKHHVFGRPESYHVNLDQALRMKLSKRVSVISSEEARTYSVSLSVMRVTAMLLQHVKGKKGEVIDRLDDPELDKIFENAILGDLSKNDLRIKDAVLFWINWSRQNFRRDLDAFAEKQTFEAWSSVTELQVEKCLHYAVNAQLSKASNVFQALMDKQHKIDEVAIHTRRHEK